MTEIAFDWPFGKTPHVLTGCAVHVWAWPLDLPSERMAALAESLAAEERSRAGEFGADQLRRHFVAGRGGMRVVLAGYLPTTAAKLEFNYTPRGKPVLAGAFAGRLQFNLAHSHGLALLAVTHTATVGVDVEKVRPMVNAGEITQRFFAPGEIAAFKTVPAEERDETFFRLWTRKEAWLKATGDGIAASLSKFEVAFLPDEPPGVRAIEGDPEASATWSICPLMPAKGFIGALAIPSRDVQLSCWRAEV